MGCYIPGMEKPKNTFRCSEKINPDERQCIYTGKIFEETLSLILDRPCKDCPLIEISTPHGRIIDADKVFAYGYQDELAIAEAPTILNAEE